ncbi:MAG: hypothetical protein QXI94_00335 [Sulfolobales archaeon]
MRVSRNLEILGGRVVSYDPGTSVVMGTFKVDMLDLQDLEKKKRFFIEHVLRDLADCRLWVKMVLSSDLCARFRRVSMVRISSSTSEALVVKLKNYVYALWCRGEARTARLTMISNTTNWRHGELVEIAHTCEKMPKLLDDIREDLMMVIGDIR